MLSKVTLFFTVAVAIVAVGAVPTGPATGPTTNQCNTGPVQCCNTVVDAKSSSLLGILGLFGLLDIGGITGLIAHGSCRSISPINIGGTACNNQAVCCTGNTFNGFINIGCTPLNIGL